MSQSLDHTFTSVRADYVHEPRIIKPQGLVVTRDGVFKFYSMMRSESVRKRTIWTAKKLVKNEIDNGNIKRYSGTGFGILSEDMLNIARWDINYPIVLMNDIYTYENEDISTAKLAEVRETGSFCIWELDIVGHERDAWKYFLASDKKERDKREYLKDFFGSQNSQSWY